jgi:predicted transcriptional regulator
MSDNHPHGSYLDHASKKVSTSKEASLKLQKLAQTDDIAAELFFQLASVDRKRILSEFQKENLHLNEVAKRCGMTATEALRQLQRMTDARLLEKSGDGRYGLTPYARIVLEASAPLDFISRFRDFFITHDAMLIPVEYRARFGELSGGVLLSTAVDTFNTVTGMLQSARERIDGTIEVGFATQLEVMKQRIAEGVKVRWLLQESYLPKARDVLRSVKKFPEMRHTPWLFGHLYQNDEAADVQLRQIDGTQDYLSFYGKDPVFLRWANDFFEYEWKKAKPWYP